MEEVPRDDALHDDARARAPRLRRARRSRVDGRPLVSCRAGGRPHAAPRRGEDSAPDAQVEQTYQHLLCGSRNHLRAVTGILESRGEPYAPRYIDDTHYREILASPHGRCGGGGGGRGFGGPGRHGRHAGGRGGRGCDLDAAPAVVTEAQETNDDQK
ncbi:MAG: DUF2202 domain-containing protein [Myxococcales bacterium]|nr:DUF2202 domain-containing protein [Myxococcales bacterium]